MQKKRLMPIMIAAAVLICSVCAIVLISGSEDHGFRSEVFRSENGWGYEIFRGRTKIISQPIVPGIPGNMPFPDKKSAESAADAVIQKLSDGEYPGLNTCIH